ncbi:MAG: heat-inducible transcriptional repressor HrcA [Oscillospiraceae bacterium]|nr:heat-inducible transcriptional repressor HrcA [Oscillospiraceae bacterium]MDD7429008.1 heat-inducible transcriptional repressor HrcA [Oscillospiraceae bacterium]MDY2847567.1 heat-inducible transcriptional repressor HrcA [Oscillospiraceae bacterium]
MPDDRKLKILAAVINEYILTGEPVGSKTIAAMPDINVSAATIRNDMALLEELGYLVQPHTSAGRIPTFSGFKLYIEKLMPERALTDDEKRRLDKALDEVEIPTETALVESASKALSEITSCAAVSSNVSPKFSVITKVEVVPTGKRMYVLLMITSSGNIKNKLCRLEFDLSNEQLEYFSNYISENLSGISVDSLSDEMIEKLSEAMGAYMMSLTPLIKAVSDLVSDFREHDVKLSGEKNLLARTDVSTDEVIRFIEQKNELSELLQDSFGGLQVLFADDGNFIVNNSSVIMSPIKKDGKNAGSLGIIGPLRLDYAKYIPYIKYLTGRITEIISDSDGDEDNKLGRLPSDDL